MSISATGLSNLSSPYEADETTTPKAADKPTTGQEVSKMAEAGNSAAQIAAQLGLSTTIVDEDLGETTSSSDATGAAAALVAVNARFSTTA